MRNVIFFYKIGMRLAVSLSSFCLSKVLCFQNVLKVNPSSSENPVIIFLREKCLTSRYVWYCTLFSGQIEAMFCALCKPVPKKANGETHIGKVKNCSYCCYCFTNPSECAFITPAIPHRAFAHFSIYKRALSCPSCSGKQTQCHTPSSFVFSSSCLWTGVNNFHCLPSVFT